MWFSPFTLVGVDPCSCVLVSNVFVRAVLKTHLCVGERQENLRAEKGFYYLLLPQVEGLRFAQCGGFGARCDLPFLNGLSAARAAWPGLVVTGAKVPGSVWSRFLRSSNSREVGKSWKKNEPTVLC